MRTFWICDPPCPFFLCFSSDNPNNKASSTSRLFLFVVISAKISTVANFETGFRLASGWKKWCEYWLNYMNIKHFGVCSLDHEVLLFFRLCFQLDFFFFFFQKVRCRDWCSSVNTPKPTGIAKWRDISPSQMFVHSNMAWGRNLFKYCHIQVDWYCLLY